MSPPKPETTSVLCEKCQENEATVHLTMVGDRLSQSKDLCEECYEATSPQFRALSAAQKDARCEYCGAQPCIYGSDILALATGVQKLKFMCTPCSIEYNRYIQDSLLGSPPGLSQREQVELIRKLDQETALHMKRWVSQRGRMDAP